MLVATGRSHKYIEEHVQRTGVAIETQGFSFVTSGKRRETLTGNATLHLYPHFKPLAEIDGVVDYLTTEICASKAKRFPLVTFVDTPGLVDGDMKYPFDVNAAILWLGNLVDLIFVFFDPIGQALCKRTLELVEALSVEHGERMRFFLSKADEAGHESDRQRVMMQIVQELCKRPTLNRTGFEMPTIFIPNPEKTTRCVNQIDEVCGIIDRTIEQTVQTTLNQLERDCDSIAAAVDAKIKNDDIDKYSNCIDAIKRIFVYIFGFLALFTVIGSALIDIMDQKLLKELIGAQATDILVLYTKPLMRSWHNFTAENGLVYSVALLASLLFLLLLPSILWRKRPTLNRRRRKTLLAYQEHVENFVKAKKKELYKEYLDQTVSEHDL